MKIQVHRSALLPALSHVQSVVDRKVVNPILSNVLLRTHEGNLHLTTTDLDMSVQEVVPATLQDTTPTTVPVIKLYEIVRKLPDDQQIELKVNKETHQMSIKSGRSRFQLPTLPAQDFPINLIDELPYSFTLSAHELKFLINQTRFASSTNEVNYALSGIYLHAPQTAEEPRILRAVAADGLRLALAQVPLPSQCEDLPSVVLPRKTIQEIAHLLEDCHEDIKVSLSLTQIIVEYGSVRLQSRLVDAPFPDYEATIPHNNTQELAINRQALKDALERVALVASDKMRNIQMVVDRGAVNLSAQSHEYGSAQEELEASYTGPCVTYNFNVRYLQEIIGQIADETILCHLGPATSPVLFRGSQEADSLFLLMPLFVE